MHKYTAKRFGPFFQSKKYSCEEILFPIFQADVETSSLCADLEKRVEKLAASLKF